MNGIDMDPFGNKLNHNHSVILPPLYSDLLDSAPFGQIKSLWMNLSGTLLDKSNHHKWIGQGDFCSHEISANDLDFDLWKKTKSQLLSNKVSFGHKPHWEGHFSTN